MPTKGTFKPVVRLHGKPQSLTASSLFFLLIVALVGGRTLIFSFEPHHF